MKKRKNFRVYSFREYEEKIEEIQKKYKKWGFENPSQFIRTATQALLDVKNQND